MRQESAGWESRACLDELLPGVFSMSPRRHPTPFCSCLPAPPTEAFLTLTPHAEPKHPPSLNPPLPLPFPVVAARLSQSHAEAFTIMPKTFVLPHEYTKFVEAFYHEERLIATATASSLAAPQAATATAPPAQAAEPAFDIDSYRAARLAATQPNVIECAEAEAGASQEACHLPSAERFASIGQKGATLWMTVTRGTKKGLRLRAASMGCRWWRARGGKERGGGLQRAAAPRLLRGKRSSPLLAPCLICLFHLASSGAERQRQVHHRPRPRAQAGGGDGALGAEP